MRFILAASLALFLLGAPVRAQQQAHGWRFLEDRGGYGVFARQEASTIAGVRRVSLLYVFRNSPGMDYGITLNAIDCTRRLYRLESGVNYRFDGGTEPARPDADFIAFDTLHPNREHVYSATCAPPIGWNSREIVNHLDAVREFRTVTSARTASAPTPPPLRAQPPVSGASRPAAARGRPVPVLAFGAPEPYHVLGRDLVRYNFEVRNRAGFPAALFAAAPGLPPCGHNANSSRTWVDIFREDGRRIYGFCALGQPSALANLWFGVPAGEAPPARIYIELIDRQTNTRYRSALTAVPAAPARPPSRVEPSSFAGRWLALGGLEVRADTRLAHYLNLDRTFIEGPINAVEAAVIDEENLDGVRTNLITLRVDCGARTVRVTAIRNYDAAHRPLPTTLIEGDLPLAANSLGGKVLSYACFRGTAPPQEVIGELQADALRRFAVQPAW